MKFDRQSLLGQLDLFYEKMCYTMWDFGNGKVSGYDIK